MKKTILLLISGLILSFSAFAYEEVLSVTDNDDNKEIYKLIVEVDDSTQSLKEIFKDTYVNGAKIKRDVFNPNDLSTNHGLILEQRDGYNILNLKSNNFDYDRGGRIIIDTLYNGITGERRGYDIELAKDKAGWRLFSNKKIVTKFHVKVLKVIIVGTVGIKSLTME